MYVALHGSRYLLSLIRLFSVRHDYGLLWCCIVSCDFSSVMCGFAVRWISGLQVEQCLLPGPQRCYRTRTDGSVPLPPPVITPHCCPWPHTFLSRVETPYSNIYSAVWQINCRMKFIIIGSPKLVLIIFFSSLPEFSQLLQHLLDA